MFANKFEYFVKLFVFFAPGSNFSNSNRKNNPNEWGYHWKAILQGYMENEN